MCTALTFFEDEQLNLKHSVYISVIYFNQVSFYNAIDFYIYHVHDLIHTTAQIKSNWSVILAIYLF